MMSTIAHISDVHFGRVDPEVADALRRDLAALRPSLVVISGDLTQRGRRWQYQAAAEYLRTLPGPQLVVPGNHDISLYAFWRRLFAPLSRYRRFITPDLHPVFQDQQMIVAGLNTARSLTWKSGRISPQQLQGLQQRLAQAPVELFRVVVTHHPFLPAPTQKRSDLVHGARRALRGFEEAGVDLVLSGHLHLSYCGDVREHHATAKRSILSVHAGTATSNRHRGGEPNAYNLVQIQRDQVTIIVRTYRKAQNAFLPSTSTRFDRRDGIWNKVGMPNHPDPASSPIAS